MIPERHGYFRIADAALITCRIIAADQRVLEQAAIGSQLQICCQRYGRKVGTPADAIEQLDRKLTVLTDALPRVQCGVERRNYGACAPVMINLSGGGVGLRASVPMAVNADLAIDLLLLSGNHRRRAGGRVVACRTPEDGNGDIGAEFVGLREDDRDLLAQHIARKQAAALREARAGG